MKKIFFIGSCIAALLAFTSCLTTNNSSVDVFSTSAKTTSGKMVVSSDEFAETKTAVHKDIGVDYSGKSMDDLYFEPYFIYNDTAVSCFLKIHHTSLGYSQTVCDKIILLGTTGKVTIKITGKTETKSKPVTSRVFGYENNSIVSEKITKEDYEKLTDFFAKNGTIRLGFYTTDNKAEEFKEYSTRAHTIFADSYAFYTENLSSKAGITEGTNPLIWN